MWKNNHFEHDEFPHTPPACDLRRWKRLLLWNGSPLVVAVAISAGLWVCRARWQWAALRFFAGRRSAGNGTRVPLRAGGSVLHACPREAMPGFPVFCCACGFLFPFFGKTEWRWRFRWLLVVGLLQCVRCRAAAMRQPYRSLNGPRSTVSTPGNETGPNPQSLSLPNSASPFRLARLPLRERNRISDNHRPSGKRPH